MINNVGVGKLFGNFYLQKTRFTLKPITEFSLPAFKGTTLRGGFGIQFKKTVCLMKKRLQCSECSLKRVCSYTYIFETSPHEDSLKLKNLKDLPRPFVIEPPLDEKRHFTETDTISFYLILIGKAIDFIPYFILTFKELGAIGLGRDKGKFKLEKVEVLTLDSKKSYKTIYSGSEDTFYNIGENIPFSSLISNHNWNNHNEITLNFLTPTRIKLDDKLVNNPDFNHIIRSLIHRISALAYFHCGEELKIDYGKLIEKSKNIEKLSSVIKWDDYERYSTKQNIKMKMGGFTGRITFRGDLDEFIPFLMLGEQVHLGKSCTFGFGKYRIEED